MKFYKVYRDFQAVNEYGKAKEFVMFELLTEKTVAAWKLQRSGNLEAVEVSKSDTYTNLGARFLDHVYGETIAYRGESYFSGDCITHLNSEYAYIKFVRGDISYYRRRKLHYSNKGVYFLDWYNRRAYLDEFLRV